MSLIVLGTVALDNVKTPSGSKKDMLGGSAAHFSMSARLFTNVHLIAVVGQDFPERHLNFLKRKGIDLTSLKVDEGKTFRWQGEYQKGDLNTALTLATELGVLQTYIPSAGDHQRRIPNVFLANFDPDLQMKLLSTLHKPQLIGLDSMNLWIQHKCSSLKKLMKQVHLFVANDAEARALTGEGNLIKAAKALSQMGPKMIVVKKGEHGVLFYSKDLMFSFPAYPVDKVVDPTGAGDTFAGALMGYLSKAGKVDEKNLRKALLYATTLASFNVEGFGMAKTAPLTMVQVESRLKTLVKFSSVH
ncbi:MAG: bifunctional hydroxymethylpyrimidine kinase/phosphomethylpyrimidine kinase [Candidatus Omnitrophica bacterium]|nr:bifunctional hydroxymethylpyrimidine kinase/phosphomethylpyrimidine kinase [Candidatus Omnitrophota bacterium]